MEPTLTTLPPKVGGFELVSEWTGEPKFPGRNWNIRCQECGETRVVNTAMWNNCHRGKSRFRCSCSKRTSRALGKRSTLTLTHNNQTLPVREWARVAAIPLASIYYRLRQRNDGYPMTDTQVLFGTDQDNPIRKDREPVARDIESALSTIRRDILELLLPSVERAIADAVNDRVRPLLYGLRIRTHEPEEEEITPLPPIPDGMVAAKDGGYYDPHPHPRDAELLFADATYRRVREEMGDELAQVYWADRSTFRDQYLFGQPQPEEPEENATVANLVVPVNESRYYCLAQHASYLDSESFDSIRITDDFQLPEGMLPQEETTPLTQDEVDYYLSTPWWEKRMTRPFNNYSFGYICRTQFERIVAWYKPAERNYPKGADKAVTFRPSYSFCVDHRTLNDYLDFFALSEWSKDFQVKVDPEDESVMAAISERYLRWAASPHEKIQQQAGVLVGWIPELEEMT